MVRFSRRMRGATATLVSALLTHPGSAQESSRGAAAGDETRWLRNIQQITSAEMGLDRSGEAYFSPDGKRISFQAYPRGQNEYQIYVMKVDGSGLNMVSTGQGATTCSYFHPNGQKLIFASNHLDMRPAETPAEVKAQAEKAGRRNYAWSFFPGMDIFEYTFADASLKRLTDADGYDAECSYSPDGKQIVFASMRDGDLEIYIMDADGRNPRRITRAKGQDGGPFFSPDGRRIVYRSDRKGEGNMQIFTNNLEGTDERRLTHDEGILHWCPYWHPTGRWLIFTRGEHPTSGPPIYDLYLLSVDGARMLRVTSDPAFDGLPVFSADGRKMMWTSRRGGLSAPQVFVADFTGLPDQDGPAGGPTSQPSAAGAPPERRD